MTTRNQLEQALVDLLGLTLTNVSDDAELLSRTAYALRQTYLGDVDKNNGTFLGFMRGLPKTKCVLICVCRHKQSHCRAVVRLFVTFW